MPIVKQLPVSVSLLLIISFTGLVATSCNNNTGGGIENSVLIPVPKDSSALAKINHFIPENKIREYRSAFRIQNDSLNRRFPELLIPEAEAFNKPAILSILKDPRCVGIRIYHGVKAGGKRNELRLILVGVDSQGNDLLNAGGPTDGADGTQPKGGLETGQCPTCQN